MASEEWGGAEKTFVDLANELSKKHRVTALLLKKTVYHNRFHRRVRVIETTSHSTRNNPLLIYEIFRIIRTLQPDLIHTHGGKAAQLIHRLSFFLKNNHLATKHNGRKGRIFNKLPYVSVVSRQARDSLSPRIGRQVRVIHNGIVPEECAGDLRNDLFGITAIGRLDHLKGFAILLSELKKVSFPYHLTIAGEGPEKKRLWQRAKDLGLAENVSMIGFCEHVPELMRRNHVIVISSHSEGFPQVMVEALFYGNVLISTPVGGVVEVLPEMFLAKHANLGEKLEHVHNNYEGYQEHFKLLRQRRAAEFDISVIAAQYKAFYDEIVASSLREK